MKQLDENLIRIKAREVSKEITNLGSPFGPNEAFYAGVKYAETQYVKLIEDLNHEIYLLKLKVDELTENGV